MSFATALVLDFNGTLSQDEHVLCAVYQDLFAEQGRPLTEAAYYEQLCGLSEEAIIAGWLAVDGVELERLIGERIRRYLAQASSGSTIAPTAREAVRYAAQRVPVAVCSGAFREEIEPVLVGAGIAREISILVTADDVVHGKPAPDCYRRVVELMPPDIDREGVVAFEDTEAGIIAAKSAGLHCLAVGSTLPPARLRLADEIVEGIDLDLIRRLVG